MYMLPNLSISFAKFKFRLMFYLSVIASIGCPLDITIIISKERTSFQKLPPLDLSEVMSVKNYLEA